MNLQHIERLFSLSLMDPVTILCWMHVAAPFASVWLPPLRDNNCNGILFEQGVAESSVQAYEGWGLEGGGILTRTRVEQATQDVRAFNVLAMHKYERHRVGMASHGTPFFQSLLPFNWLACHVPYVRPLRPHSYPCYLQLDISLYTHTYINIYMEISIWKMCAGLPFGIVKAHALSSKLSFACLIFAEHAKDSRTRARLTKTPPHRQIYL